MQKYTLLRHLVFANFLGMTEVLLKAGDVGALWRAKPVLCRAQLVVPAGVADGGGRGKGKLPP